MSKRYEYVKLPGRDGVLRTRRVVKAKTPIENPTPTAHDTLMLAKAEAKRERRRLKRLEQLQAGGYR